MWYDEYVTRKGNWSFLSELPHFIALDLKNYHLDVTVLLNKMQNLCIEVKLKKKVLNEISHINTRGFTEIGARLNNLEGNVNDSDNNNVEAVALILFLISVDI